MPTPKIHLAIAKKINERLNLDSDSFILGSVLPDLCKTDHKVAHFQVGEKDLEGLSNPDTFVAKYKDKLNNPLMVGYLVHLLSDRYYNEYTFKHFYIYDENDNSIGIYLKGKKKMLDSKMAKLIKHNDLFIYDAWLLNHKYVPRFNNTDCINNIEDIEGIDFNREQLKNYINDANASIDNRTFLNKIMLYNFKITNKKEYDAIFNGCVDYCLDYIKKLEIL